MLKGLFLLADTNDDASRIYITLGHAGQQIIIIGTVYAILFFIILQTITVCKYMEIKIHYAVLQ